MRAVLGLLFLMGGLTMGYLVLSGKFPNAGAAPASTSVAPASTSVNAPLPNPLSASQQAQNMIQKNAGAGGPWGMSQAAAYAYDLNAARGVQQS